MPNVVIGDLPGGLAGSWLAHFRIEHDDDRTYTVVVVAAEASVHYAVRVICHDRGLPDRDASNPDAEHQLVEMDDRQVEFESEALVGRYEISTDHDQDQVRAWQLFDPSVIRWLVDGAPDDFSFELQDGALCGFVPGALGEAGELDALCEATATVHTRVVEIAEPFGVVAAIVPSTNPTSTAIYKILIAIKARCSIVLSPHPAAVKGAELFAVSGCLNCHVYLGAGGQNLGAPELTAEGAKNKGIAFQIAHLQCPACKNAGSPMPSFSGLGLARLKLLATFLEASKGPK